jgi:hypothetical protein
MMSPGETGQRALALIGAGLAQDSDRIDLLTEDLDRDELREMVRVFALKLASDFHIFCPDPQTARALLTEAAIQAALEGSGA